MSRERADLIGAVYGNWLILLEEETATNHRKFWCRCDCGVERSVSHTNLIRAATKQNPKCRKCVGLVRRVDRVGMRFGRWTIVSEAERRRNTTIYRCRCDCGDEYNVWHTNLITGASSQCIRCRKNDQFKYVPGEKIGQNTVLARDGKRAKLQCGKCGRKRWSVSLTQAGGCICNRKPLPKDTHGRMLSMLGETHNMAEWARRIGISREGLRLRLLKGMTLETALTSPRDPGGRRARSA